MKTCITVISFFIMLLVSCQHKSQNTSLDDEYGNRSYVFFLSAKVGSNEYAHDIVTFEIAGDSLRPLYNYNIHI